MIRIFYFNETALWVYNVHQSKISHITVNHSVFTDVTPPVFQGCPDQVVFSRGPGTYQLEDFVQGVSISF